jgi:hypothetical protein
LEQWLPVPDFPGYSVSTSGEVRNDTTERLLTPIVLPRGVYVGITRNRTQHNRMVARLVAEAFVEPPEFPSYRETFKTPINLNGDRTDNRKENLMWRPRWFAVKYHHQFSVDWSDGPRIKELDSGLRFANALEAAMTYGLLALEVFVEAMNHGSYGRLDYGVWPIGCHFVSAHNKSRPNRRL